MTYIIYTGIVLFGLLCAVTCYNPYFEKSHLQPSKTQTFNPKKDVRTPKEYNDKYPYKSLENDFSKQKKIDKIMKLLRKNYEEIQKNKKWATILLKKKTDLEKKVRSLGGVPLGAVSNSRFLKTKRASLTKKRARRDPEFSLERIDSPSNNDLSGKEEDFLAGKSAYARVMSLIDSAEKIHRMLDRFGKVLLKNLKKHSAKPHRTRSYEYSDESGEF